MKLKIISIEPNYSDLPAMSMAAKVGIHFEMRQIVQWQVTKHKDTMYKDSNTPIIGETYTVEIEGTAILEAVKKDAIKLIHTYQEHQKAFSLPGKEFMLVPVEKLEGKEFEIGDVQ
jgi:hypothetical protein